MDKKEIIQKETIGFWQSKINIGAVVGAVAIAIPEIIGICTALLELLLVFDANYTLDPFIKDLIRYLGIAIFILQAVLRTLEKNHKNIE
jgi:hypothetical protein